MCDDSILVSVKKMLGIDESYDDFDLDIIVQINSAIHTLYQVGYEPAKNFVITGIEESWDELAGDDNDLSLIKNYIFIKTRILFDPPTSSFVLTSYQDQLKELEWRIYIEAEGGFNESDESDESEEDDTESGTPWDGVPGNGEDESDEPDESELPDTLRNSWNEMGRS